MIIIDVREPYEYASSHVNGAINVPLSTLSGDDQLDKVAKDEQILVYCNSGNRSGAAKDILDKQGFSNVTNAINQQYVEANRPSA